MSLLAAECATARVLAQPGRLADLIPRVLEAICTALGWQYGALWQLDRHANRLRCVETWAAPGAGFTGFEAASRQCQTLFERGIGLPGRVWATGRPAFIPDVAVDTKLSARVCRVARRTARGVSVSRSRLKAT